MSEMHIEQDGKRYDFDRYDYPQHGDVFLHGNGYLRRIEPGEPLDFHFRVAVFRPVPVRHTFGGIVFEETGDMRQPEEGEWILNNGHPQYAAMVYLATFPILRPVRLES